MKQNILLSRHAQDRVLTEVDNRSKIREILRNAPIGKRKEDSTRVYKEAVKRSLKRTDYWAPPPAGFKGNRIQWKVTQALEQKLANQIKKGTNTNKM